MHELTYLFVGLAFSIGSLLSICIWSRRKVGVKILSGSIAVVILVIGYAALAELLSRPKPVALEWWHDNAEEATVLGASFEEDRAIHLWLRLPNVTEPRAYSLPWNRDLAEQLQTAQREAAQNHTDVQMRLPFEGSLDDREPKFYAMPQPAPPPKDIQSPAQIFRRPAETVTPPVSGQDS